MTGMVSIFGIMPYFHIDLIVPVSVLRARKIKSRTDTGTRKIAVTMNSVLIKEEG